MSSFATCPGWWGWGKSKIKLNSAKAEAEAWQFIPQFSLLKYFTKILISAFLRSLQFNL